MTIGSLDAQVIINGVDRTAYLTSIKRDSRLAEVGQVVALEFSHALPQTTINPWHTLVIYEQGVKTLTGYVENIEPRRPENVVEIRGKDTYKRATDFFVADQILSNAESIDYWANYYCNLCGLSHGAIPSSGSFPVEVEIPMGLRTVDDGLKALCRFAGWYMRVDTNGVLEFIDALSLDSLPPIFFDLDTRMAGHLAISDKDTRNVVKVWGYDVALAEPLNVVQRREIAGLTPDRVMAVGSPNISTVLDAEVMANRLLDFFANIGAVPTINIIGKAAIQVGNAGSTDLFFPLGYNFIADTITDLHAEMNERGYEQEITLARRSQHLPTYPVKPLDEIVLYVATKNELGREVGLPTGTPTFSDIRAAPLAGDFADFALDRSAWRTKGWVVGSQGVFLSQDIHIGSPDWVLVKTNASLKVDIAALSSGGYGTLENVALLRVGTSRAKPHSAWVLIRATYFSGASFSYRIWVAHTHNNGQSWDYADVAVTGKDLTAALEVSQYGAANMILVGLPNNLIGDSFGVPFVDTLPYSFAVDSLYENHQHKVYVLLTRTDINGIPNGICGIGIMPPAGTNFSDFITFPVSGSGLSMVQPRSTSMVIASIAPTTPSDDNFIVVNPVDNSISATFNTHAVVGDLDHLVYAEVADRICAFVSGGVSGGMVTLNPVDFTYGGSTVSARPLGLMVYCPLENALYVTLDDTSAPEILVIDPTSLAVLASLTLSPAPSPSLKVLGMVYCPSNDRMYVWAGNDVYAITPGSHLSSHFTYTFSNSLMYKALYCPANNRLYAPHVGSVGSEKTVVINPETNTVEATISGKPGGNGGGTTGGYCQVSGHPFWTYDAVFAAPTPTQYGIQDLTPRGNVNKLFKSTDGGHVFTLAHSFTEKNHFNDVRLPFVGGASDDIVYVSEAGRVMKSTDGGTTFLDITPDNDAMQPYPYTLDVFFLSANFLSFTNGLRLFTSTDAGATWNVRGLFTKICRALRVDRRHPNRVFRLSASGATTPTSGCVFMTLNGGATWVDITDQWATAIGNFTSYGVAVDMAEGI